MKILFSSLLFIFVMNTVFASIPTVEQLRNNLITNTWHEKDAKEWTGFGLMMEFHDNGVANVISNTRSEWPAMARYTWNVDIQRENPVLTFRDYSGASFSYTALQTLRGLDLLPFESEMRSVIHLSYGTQVTPIKWNNIQRTLLGKWENTVLATQFNSVIPQFRFNGDGTYAFSFAHSNGVPVESEMGRWMLSKCADFIVLMPHNTDTLEFAKIRLISADEMVVEQLIVIKGSLVVNKEVKNMFFNKL